MYWISSYGYNVFTFNLTDGTNNYGNLWVDSLGSNAAVYVHGLPWMVDVGTIKPFIKAGVKPNDFKLPNSKRCVPSV